MDRRRGSTKVLREQADIAGVTADHVAAARRAATAGFDLLELYYAHGSRQETGIPTMTWARSPRGGRQHDHRSGRADRCCLARPHLIDPYWTLNAALDQNYRVHPAPKQYRSGTGARRRARRT